MDMFVDLHVALPRSIASALDRAARDGRTNRTRLLRRAVEDLLERLERERVEREMADYVERHADASREFARETWAPTRRRLLRDTSW